MEHANRNWVAVSSIMLRFWKGVGFGKSFSEPADEAQLKQLPPAQPVPKTFFGTQLGRKDPPGNSRKRNSAQSSPLFQQMMGQLCQSDGALVNDFLNQLFNTLNWCVSEFTVGMSDYKTAISGRRDSSHVQKKVIIMFELSANLIRLLEIVAMHGPKLFLDLEMPNARISLERASETLTHIKGCMHAPRSVSQADDHPYCRYENF